MDPSTIGFVHSKGWFLLIVVTEGSSSGLAVGRFDVTCNMAFG